MEVLIINLAPVEQINSAIMRTMALANGFAELNHRVDFLTVPSSETHATTERKHYHENINIVYAQKSQRYEALVKQERSNKIGKFIVNVARKAYHKLSLYDYTLDIAKKVKLSVLPKQSYDLIISVSDPKTSHIATKNLIGQGLKYNKWIQYWGDPMTLDITNKSIYPKWFYKKTEKNLIGNSEIVLYASPLTLSEQIKIYPELESRMHYIPTPYVDEIIYKKNEKNTKQKIGYFGAYNSHVRNLLPLYNSAKNLSDDVDLILVGNTDLKLETTENIKVLPRQDVSHFESEVDLFVCVLNNKGTQIPGKIFQNSASNKPILIIVDGEYGDEIEDYFKQFDRYMFTNNNEKDITTALQQGVDQSLKNEPVKEFHSQSVVKSLLDKMQ